MVMPAVTEERVMTLKEGTDAVKIWHQLQRYLNMPRGFIARLTVYNSYGLPCSWRQGRLRQNGSPSTYDLVVWKVNDVVQLMRAIRGGNIHPTVIFSPPAK